ncbi:hypothetical protein [Polaromonas eurypsychrophila]|nr:hypothetical protein [Polaromonas eurypsychrophila]
MAKYSKILITGLGRSGTTAVASIIKNIGYFLGEEVSHASLEDFYLRRLLASGEIDSVRTELYRRCEKHDLVAYKDPKLFGLHGQKLLSKITNDWLYIFVIRDVLSISRRNVKSIGVELDAALLNATHSQLKLINFYKKVKLSNPTYIVSFEQLNSIEEFLKEFTSFLGFDMSTQQLDDLRVSVGIDKGRYLSIANIKI